MQDFYEGLPEGAQKLIRKLAKKLFASEVALEKLEELIGDAETIEGEDVVDFIEEHTELEIDEETAETIGEILEKIGASQLTLEELKQAVI